MNAVSVKRINAIITVAMVAIFIFKRLYNYIFRADFPAAGFPCVSC